MNVKSEWMRKMESDPSLWKHGTPAHDAAVAAQAAAKSTGSSLPERIVLEATGYARGRQFVDGKLSRVRVGDGAWRDAKSSDLDAAIKWLMEQEYSFRQVVGDQRTAGTTMRRYFFER